MKKLLATLLLLACLMSSFLALTSCGDESLNDRIPIQSHEKAFFDVFMAYIEKCAYLPETVKVHEGFTTGKNGGIVLFTYEQMNKYGSIEERNCLLFTRDILFDYGSVYEGDELDFMNGKSKKGSIYFQNDDGAFLTDVGFYFTGDPKGTTLDIRKLYAYNRATRMWDKVTEELEVKNRDQLRYRSYVINDAIQEYVTEHGLVSGVL